MFNLFDGLTDEPAPVLMTTEEIIADGEAKKLKVLRHIEANPSFPLKGLVEKFDLDWGFDGPKVVFYADVSMRVEIMSLHLDQSEWVRVY